MTEQANAGELRWDMQRANEWLEVNHKTANEVRWGTFPFGMVQNWIERAEEAEAALTEARTALEAVTAERDEARQFVSTYTLRFPESRAAYKGRAEAAEQQLAAARADAARLAKMRLAIPKDFVNLQLDDKRDEDDLYSILVDVGYDKGHPILESYYLPLLAAIYDALAAHREEASRE